MKSKIVRPDGTIIEIEGTQQEVTEIVQKLAPAPFTWPMPAVTNPAPPVKWTEFLYPNIDWGFNGPCRHKYPTSWMSVSPPTCEICHQPAAAAGPSWTISGGYVDVNNVAST